MLLLKEKRKSISFPFNIYLLLKDAIITGIFLECFVFHTIFMALNSVCPLLFEKRQWKTTGKYFLLEQTLFFRTYPFTDHSQTQGIPEKTTKPMTPHHRCLQGPSAPIRRSVKPARSGEAVPNPGGAAARRAPRGGSQPCRSAAARRSAAPLSLADASSGRRNKPLDFHLTHWFTTWHLSRGINSISV